jgi:hypothetical protein
MKFTNLCLREMTLEEPVSNVLVAVDGLKRPSKIEFIIALIVDWLSTEIGTLELTF